MNANRPDSKRTLTQLPLTARKPILNRRRFVGGLGIGLASAAGMYGWATRYEPHWLEVTQHPLRIAHLPASLQNKTLVQISDLHIGSTDEDYLVSVMRTVNELRPDILVITGDIIDQRLASSDDTIQRVLTELRLQNVPTIACLGNHDYGRRWRQVEIADRVAGVMSDIGIQVLRDQQMHLDGLSIFGLDDYWSPRFQAAQVLQQARQSEPAICLCHNPDVCDEPLWGDFQGIILSGHTHGGQCKPPFLPPPLIPVQNRRYTNGFYDIGDGRTMYINRGIGYGFRARFNCRPELSVFHLTA